MTDLLKNLPVRHYWVGETDDQGRATLVTSTGQVVATHEDETVVGTAAALSQHTPVIAVDLTDRDALLVHLLADHGWHTNPAGVVDDDLEELVSSHDDDHDDVFMRTHVHSAQVIA